MIIHTKVNKVKNGIFRKEEHGLKLKDYEIIDNPNNIKNYIMIYGPILAAIDVTSTGMLMFYKDGIFDDLDCTSSDDVNHAVVIYGWGYDEELKIPYWIIRNSWGVRWGDEGYFKLSANKTNSCGIEAFPIVTFYEYLQ